MAELDAKRTTVSANIQDAEKRLEALKEVQQFAPPPPVDAEEHVHTKCGPTCRWVGSLAHRQVFEPRQK